MVRIRAGETFQAAVEREWKQWKLSESMPNPKPKEGITAGATTSTSACRGRGPNETKGSAGEEGRLRRRCRRRRLGFSRQDSMSSGYDAPLAPPSPVRTEAAGVPQGSQGSGSCGPEMPPTEGDGVPKKSKVSGLPPLGMQTDGASVSQKSKGSVSYGPTMPPPGVRAEGAGVLELIVEDTDALDCFVCFLPLKPPIFQGRFSKEAIECELTYSRYVSSKSRSTGDQLTDHFQRCKFRVALTDPSNGLPSNNDCFQFVVPNFALGENKEKVQVQGRIFISSSNLC